MVQLGPAMIVHLNNTFISKHRLLRILLKVMQH